MPTIRVEMFEGRTLEQKKKLVEEVAVGSMNLNQVEPDAIRALR